MNNGAKHIQKLLSTFILKKFMEIVNTFLPIKEYQIILFVFLYIKKKIQMTSSFYWNEAARLNNIPKILEEYIGHPFVL